MAYNSIHTGSTVDTAVTKTTNMPAFGAEVANYASLPGSPSTGDVVLVTGATTGHDAGLYRYSGSAWVYMGNPRQDADDIDDSSTTHKFVTEADITKLSNTSGTNTGDQNLSTYQLKPSEGAFVNGDKTHLDTIETNADVTDTANVTAAGALMDSEVTNLAQVKAFASSDYATAAQGTKADSALQSVAGDTSPQLGANLDVQAREINTSTSNGNIKLNPNGTGCVEAMGDGTTSGTAGAIQINCSYNTHGIKIQSPAHDQSATYTLTLPTAVGSNNAILATTSAGVLSFTNSPTLTTPIVTTLDMAGAIQELTSNSTTITGNTALNAGGGTVQRWVLSGAVNITDSLNEGESVTLVIGDGSGNQITWNYNSLNIEWVSGSAPTLDTTNETIVVIWKLNSTLYGMTPGVAS